MKVFLFAATLVAGLSVAWADTVCSTRSNGQNFERRGYNAQQDVVRDCKQRSNTRFYECEQNLSCYEEQANYPGRPGPGRPGPGPGPGPGRPGGALYAQMRYCQTSSMCTYDIHWSAGYNQPVAVTVEVVGESRPQLFACGSGNGSSQAPWVQIGKRYVFRMYNTSDCSQYVSRYPANDTLDLIGGR